MNNITEETNNLILKYIDELDSSLDNTSDDQKDN
jgi:hypothetical protein